MYALDGGWFDPWRALIHYLGTPGDATADWMSRANGLASERAIQNSTAQPIRFVSTSQSGQLAGGAAQARDYEMVVSQSGEVPTRAQGGAAWHDYFNALMWLAWPHTKRVINHRQAEEIGSRGISGQRGALRDALTLFDEGAVLFVSEQRSAIEDLRQHNWRQLFVERRDQFGSQLRCVVIGHALLHKLMRPYKSICGHALPLQLPVVVSAQVPTLDTAGAHQARPAEVPAGGLHVSPAHRIATALEHQFGELDATAAALLASDDFGKDSLAPMPILGVPGWWPANEQPEFYNDSQVFRTRAKRMRPVDTKETKA